MEGIPLRDTSIENVDLPYYDEDSSYSENNTLSSGYDSVDHSSDDDKDASCGIISSSLSQKKDIDDKEFAESSLKFHLDDHSSNKEVENELRISTKPNEREDDVLVPIQPSNTTLSCFAVMGMLRYAWSYVAMIVSTDLLVVYTINVWITVSQKWNRLEQLRLLRSDRRWGAHVLEDSVKQFHAKNTQTFDWSQRMSFFHAYEAAARENDQVLDKKWDGIALQSESSKLPPYYRLCLMVQRELIAKMEPICYFRHFSVLISFVIAFSGVGHLLTLVGRKNWGIVMWKFFLFACACLGFWTDEIYEAYEIEELVKEFTIADPDEATILFIPLTIISRVILLQALGGTATLISIVVINLCGAPLFVFSPKLRKNIPPLIHTNPREVAVKREKIELLGRHDAQASDDLVGLEEWVITVRSLGIFFTESRLLVFFYNLVSLSLTIILLKGIEASTTTLALLLTGMLPYFVGSSFIAILYVGKRLKLTDKDFRVVFSRCRFLSFSSIILPSRARVSTTSEQEEVVRSRNNEETNSLDIDRSDDSSVPSELIAPMLLDMGSSSRSSEDDPTFDNYYLDDGDTVSHGSGSFTSWHSVSAPMSHEDGSMIGCHMDQTSWSDRDEGAGQIISSF